jgi:hypothetical protein
LPGAFLEEKISEYEFVVWAIKRLKKSPDKGIHSLYGGFNQAFREYFNKDPVEATTKLAQEGKIVTRPVKGGTTLYLPEDAPSKSKGILCKILGEDDSGKEGGWKGISGNAGTL